MMNILLIDDEKDVRESVAQVLSRAGYRVETTDNAEMGLAMLEENDFDLLISDIIMPGIDGVQAIKAVREKNKKMKILAISGGGNFGLKDYKPLAINTAAYLQAAAAAGADSILTKPFTRAELVELVNNLLQPE
jgi:DNA-binding response OmpR family regulator